MRVSAWWTILGAIGEFIRNINLSVVAKLSVYKSMWVPTLMYGCECTVWAKT